MKNKTKINNSGRLRAAADTVRSAAVAMRPHLRLLTGRDEESKLNRLMKYSARLEHPCSTKQEQQKKRELSERLKPWNSTSAKFFSVKPLYLQTQAAIRPQQFGPEIRVRLKL